MPGTRPRKDVQPHLRDPAHLERLWAGRDRKARERRITKLADQLIEELREAAQQEAQKAPPINPTQAAALSVLLNGGQDFSPRPTGAAA